MQIETRDMFWHARVDGATDAPPLVMLHGFAQSLTSFDPLLPTLTREFRVIRFDMPGHGATRMKSARALNWSVLNDNLHEAVQSIEARSAHWFGYSQGGRVALMAALAQPENVKSLALLGTSTGIADEQERKRRSESDHLLAQNVVLRGMEWFSHYWESLPMFATQKLLPDAMQTHIREQRMACKPEGLALALESFGTATMPDCLNALCAWSKPLLLMAGEADTKFVASNAQVARESRSALLYNITFPGAGHAAHLERPHEFTKTLSAFLSAAQGSAT